MKIQRITYFLSVTLLVLVLSATAQAGTLFTTQGAFDAAVAAFTLVWSEDFEGFSLGPVADPLGIAGNQGEVLDGGNASILGFFGPTGQIWLQSGGTNANATIRGFGNTSLGLSALSFNFGNELIQTIDFVHTLGTDTSGAYAPTGGATDRFAGWIGSGSELLNLAQFTQTEGTTLDNIRAYTSVPEPGTLFLLGSGLMGLGVFRRFTG